MSCTLSPIHGVPWEKSGSDQEDARLGGSLLQHRSPVTQLAPGGCLSSKPQNLHCRGLESKLEKAPSKRKPSTNPQASHLQNFRSAPVVEPSDHRLIPLYSLIYSSVYKHRRKPAVFRDQLYKHFETVPAGDFEAFTNKLIQAGSSLEFLKYADPLFEILFVGGLLQPGGSYIDDGSPICPWAIVNAKEPASAEELKKYIDVQNKLIRRYGSSCKLLVKLTLRYCRLSQI